MIKHYLSLLIGLSSLFCQSSLNERFTSLNELEDQINQWHIDFGSNSDPFPFAQNEGIIFHHEIIGYTSVDNLPIWAIKLSFNADLNEDEPKILILGQCHAEEIYGLEISMELIDWFLNPTNPGNSTYYQSILTILSQAEIWVIPTYNPEGLSVVHGWYDNGIWTQDVSFRKNKYDANMNSQFDFIVGIGDDIDGVDLNRNYDFNWVFGDEYNQLDTGCSTNPSYLSNYDYYRGPYPFSESEVRAVRDFALENDFLLSVAYHSSRSGCVSEKVISPWLWEDEKPAPDLEVISELGVQIAELIPSEDGLGYYYPGNSISMRGNAHDWFYKETGCIQYLIEVGSSNMQPDNVDLIESTISHNMQGLMHLLKRGAGSNVQNGPDINQVSGIVTNISGQPIVAKVELVELSGPMLTDRYTDSFGRFRRLLGQDSYSLIVSAFGYETYYGTVSSSSSSITDISIILNEQPKYNINLDFTNSIDADYNIEIKSSYKIDYLTLYSEVLNLEYPIGNYEIMITSDLSYPKLLSFDLNEDIDFDLSINCNCLLMKEDFDNLNNWNISNADFIIDDNKLISQNGKVYSSNLDSYLKSTIDLSALKDFSNGMFLEINLKNELEWENDKLSFILESEDGSSYSSVVEISDHDFEFHKIIVPIQVEENNTYLKMIFKTDSTVNYRGFSIEDIKVLFELDGLKGDLDLSSDINVLDVIALIDLIFDSNNSNVGCREDLNNDSNINIFDIITLVEIILNN
tara:strand:- start:663 stop:2897 length:2235 start_codon:yes stop_codon:yes gene_type:complete